MNHNNDITKECVRILYDNANVSNITVVFSSFIMAYIFKDQISGSHLFTWVTLMVFLSLIRFWLLLDYKKTNEKLSDHVFFETRYTFITTATGIGWAIFLYWGLTLPLFEYRLYSILFLTAIIAIASPLFSSSIKILYLYLIPIVTISLPLLLLAGDKESAIGFALIVFTFMVIRSTKNMHNTLINVLTLRFKTQEMDKDIIQLHHEKSETEQRMQSLMDYSPAAIYVKDLDGHFIFLNQKVADLHQMSREDIIGKTLYDILPHDIADTIHENDVNVIKNDSPVKYEESAPQDDGLHHYISIKFPLYDDTGKIYAVGGISTDITERFRIEESLRLSQQRLLLYREQSPLGIIEWNTNFEFLDWNPAAEKIFGYKKEEVQGQHITDRILPENDKLTVNKMWDELITNTGGTYNLKTNITKDGKIILCEWHNTPLMDADGNVIGVTSLVEDVTERQRNEDNLRHSQKMDAIGKLTGGIAHDFNNMIGVIIGFSRLLKKHIPQNDSKAERYGEQIINAAERAKKLTSNLLEFSRKAPSIDKLTQPNTLLLDMKHMLEKTLTPRIKLELFAENTIWPLWLDKARLEDAILNMSINSMHAMPDGGTLTLSLNNKHLLNDEVKNMNINTGDYVVLTIKDTGSGISHDVQSKMFDPFFSTKGTEGTGLGLSQVYGFVQQSKGDISVLSEENKGTVIMLYFPRCQRKNIIKSEYTSSELIAPSSGKETILIVDDEPSLLELMEAILFYSDYSVLRATNAEQALEVLKHHSVDVLISDVIMPGIDGFQLASKVEKLYPDIKIQMVSGYTDDTYADLKNDALHQQLLPKPFTPDELLKKVSDLLNN